MQDIETVLICRSCDERVLCTVQMSHSCDERVLCTVQMSHSCDKRVLGTVQMFHSYDERVLGTVQMSHSCDEPVEKVVFFKPLEHLEAGQLFRIDPLLKQHSVVELSEALVHRGLSPPSCVVESDGAEHVPRLAVFLDLLFEALS